MNDILTSSEDGILRVRFNRPESGNATSDEMARELTRLIGSAAEAHLAVVLEGAGSDFCVGRASMGRRPESRPEALERRRSSEVVFECYHAIRQASVPVIAVVRGQARGFGCALAGLSDITLAARSARFQIPEIEHNIMPTMVMSALIDRVSAKALAFLVYSAKVISADEAKLLSLVSDVAADDDLDALVDTFCAALRRAPRPAIPAVKEFLRVAPEMSVAGTVDFARNLHATINSSREMLKG